MCEDEAARLRQELERVVRDGESAQMQLMALAAAQAKKVRRCGTCARRDGDCATMSSMRTRAAPSARASACRHVLTFFLTDSFR